MFELSSLLKYCLVVIMFSRDEMNDDNNGRFCPRVPYRRLRHN